MSKNCSKAALRDKTSSYTLPGALPPIDREPMNQQSLPTEPTLLRGRWFDPRRSQPRSVLAGVIPGPDGANLRLHPIDEPTAVAEFTSDALDWPIRRRGAYPSCTAVVDLHERGSVEIDDAPPWLLALSENRPAREPDFFKPTGWVWLATGLMLLAAAIAAAIDRHLV
jgi:hypothetical protein